jgi:CubicO group peptidase (beta-lactamase class C family)
MRRSSRIGLVLVAFALALSPATSAQPLADHPDVQEAVRFLDTWMDGQRAYQQVPGLSAAVVHGDETVWSRGFGVMDRETGEPATAETVYSICSISKLFTSMAVLQLRDEGRLSLADPVGEHLDWFDIAQTYPDGPPVTVWGLLTHSAGLPRESAHPYWSAPDFPFPTREEIREQLAGQTTLYPAARHFQYSNLGLTLAGEIVAEVSGESYDDYVQAHLLAPLGLADTRPEMPSRETEPRLARGYGSMNRDAERLPVAPFTARGIAPAAGFSSNALDLARFASWQLALLDEDRDDDDAPIAEVLSPNTLREMQRVQWLEPDWELARGLGFGVYKRGGDILVGHSGSCPGYRSTVLVEHDAGLGATVLANASGVSVESYARQAMKILEPALAAASKDDDSEGDEDEETEESPDVERFTGHYDLQPWSGEMAIVPWKDGLAAIYLPSDDPLEEMDHLKPAEDDDAAYSADGTVFRRVRDDGELGETVVFELDDSGRAVAVRTHSNRYRRLDN